MRTTLAKASAMVALAAAATLTFHRALGYGFAQDDFYGLAQSSGLLPKVEGPWRLLSHHAYFALMAPWAGLNPFPYHLASLLAHLGCTLLLFHLVARRFSPWAAFVAAAFFAVHPAHFTALYWITARGDVMAGLFGLIAVGLALSGSRLRVLAVPAFALSLLSKESTLLLPAVVWLLGRRFASRPPGRALLAGLAAVAIAYAAWFFTASRFAAGGTAGAESAYALDLAGGLGRNLFTYLGWTVNFAYPTVRHFSDAVDPSVFVPAAVALAAWGLGLAWRPLRERGWAEAGAAFVLLLAPVLPLRNHTYHYYLYAPLMAAALALAALWDSARRGAPAGQRAGNAKSAATSHEAAFALGAALLLAVNGAALVHKVETHPFLLPELRADPVVDRARIAKNVRDGLARADLPAGTTIVFVPRSRISPGAAAGGGQPLSPNIERYLQENLRAALLDGFAVRVMFPQVDSVAFAWDPPASGPGERIAIYAPDGTLEVLGP